MLVMEPHGCWWRTNERTNRIQQVLAEQPVKLDATWAQWVIAPGSWLDGAPAVVKGIDWTSSPEGSQARRALAVSSWTCWARHSLTETSVWRQDSSLRTAAAHAHFYTRRLVMSADVGSVFGTNYTRSTPLIDRPAYELQHNASNNCSTSNDHQHVGASCLLISAIYHMQSVTQSLSSQSSALTPNYRMISPR